MAKETKEEKKMKISFVIKPIQLLETDKHSEVYKVTLKNHTIMILFIYCLKPVNGFSSSNSRLIYHLKKHRSATFEESHRYSFKTRADPGWLIQKVMGDAGQTPQTKQFFEKTCHF
jgi:hypothetical protein